MWHSERFPWCRRCRRAARAARAASRTAPPVPPEVSETEPTKGAKIATGSMVTWGTNWATTPATGVPWPS